MEKKLEKYINGNLKYYQDMFNSLFDNVQGLTPQSRKSTALVIRAFQEMIGYMYKSLEAKEIALALGVTPVMNSLFEERIGKDEYKNLYETNFILNSNNVLSTDEDKTFKELYAYLNSNKDSVDKNKEEGK
jgi:hypothetical protein